MESDTQTDWLARTDARLALLPSEFSSVDVDATRKFIARAIGGIDPPPDRCCRAVLSLMLIEICSRLVQWLHESHDTARCGCHQAAWSGIGKFTESTRDDPRPVFHEWMQEWFAHFEREHPRTAATRAAALIRSEPARMWTLKELACAIEERPRRLVQDFRARFGMPPAMYRHLVRTAKAVMLLGTPSKVEAIAWEVGYRSKKDFYRALKRWAGATPTELRALSHQEREWLERQLRVRCAGKICGAPESEDTPAWRQ